MKTRHYHGAREERRNLLPNGIAFTGMTESEIRHAQHQMKAPKYLYGEGTDYPIICSKSAMKAILEKCP